MVDANLARRSVQHSRAACRSIIWEIWALSVDDREVDSVVVDEGETDELASDVRIGLSAGGSRIRTLGPGITVDTVFLGLLGILPSAAGIRALGRLSIDFGSTPARRKTPAATAPFRPYPASVAR